MPSVSVENYLKAIYRLQSRVERVKTKDLAEALDVSLPSITNMLKSLSAEGLVAYQPYKGARLTEKGGEHALKVIRKHRLVEMFLVETLGFTWDEVHVEAEQLEHAVSDLVAERMAVFLGDPKFDPHGDPIPTAQGVIHETDSIPLSTAEPGFQGRVVRVLDQAPDVLRHLTRVGLTPSSQVKVLALQEVDGQMQLEVASTVHIISQMLASRLMVLENQ